MKRCSFNLVMLVLLFCFGSGCAKQPQMSREEWISVTTHEYKGVSVNDSLIATEKLLRLADGDDFKVVHMEKGLYATRPWLVYLVFAAAMGTDYWKVTATEIDGGVKMTMYANVSASAVTPMPTTGGDLTASSMPMAGSPVMGPALYDLFWSRLDYLLGKGEQWTTCEDIYKKVRDKELWGDVAPLCNGFNVADKMPEDLRPDSAKKK